MEPTSEGTEWHEGDGGSQSQRPVPPACAVAVLTAPREIGSIALLNPLGDYGISQYTYELAEGLAASGVRVDVYANGGSRPEDFALPRRHRYLPVLGSLLLRQRAMLYRGANEPPRTAHATARPVSTWLAVARNTVLMVELAWHLRRSRYDLVWTQWPTMGPGSGWFWWLGKALGLRLAHTVHNVLPHEVQSGDRRRHASVYHACDTLFVHSQQALRDMQATFPEVLGKTRVMNHGLYTLYHRRPEAREATRRRLGIEPHHVALLSFGPIRPYKNVEAVITALSAGCNGRTVLVLVGREKGYPDCVPGDPLGRTRRLAEQLGVGDRVRFVGHGVDFAETAEIFEAADVLVLPYRKNYGSGVLLLGMTFGKFIVASRTGGMDEYLHQYPPHEILKSDETEDVVTAIERAIRRVSEGGVAPPPPMPYLHWTNIARVALDVLQR